MVKSNQQPDELVEIDTDTADTATSKANRTPNSATSACPPPRNTRAHCRKTAQEEAMKVAHVATTTPIPMSAMSAASKQATNVASGANLVAMRVVTAKKTTPTTPLSRKQIIAKQTEANVAAIFVANAERIIMKRLTLGPALSHSEQIKQNNELRSYAKIPSSVLNDILNPASLESSIEKKASEKASCSRKMNVSETSMNDALAEMTAKQGPGTNHPLIGAPALVRPGGPLRVVRNDHIAKTSVSRRQRSDATQFGNVIARPHFSAMAGHPYLTSSRHTQLRKVVLAPPTGAGSKTRGSAPPRRTPLTQLGLSRPSVQQTPSSQPVVILTSTAPVPEELELDEIKMKGLPAANKNKKVPQEPASSVPINATPSRKMTAKQGPGTNHPPIGAPALVRPGGPLRVVRNDHITKSLVSRRQKSDATQFGNVIPRPHISSMSGHPYLTSSRHTQYRKVVVAPPTGAGLKMRGSAPPRRTPLTQLGLSGPSVQQTPSSQPIVILKSTAPVPEELKLTENKMKGFSAANDNKEVPQEPTSPVSINATPSRTAKSEIQERIEQNIINSFDGVLKGNIQIDWLVAEHQAPRWPTTKPIQQAEGADPATIAIEKTTRENPVTVETTPATPEGELTAHADSETTPQPAAPAVREPREQMSDYSKLNLVQLIEAVFPKTNLEDRMVTSVKQLNQIPASTFVDGLLKFIFKKE